MKPIHVSVHVDRPRDEVYAFLDVLANHEQFTDHMLVDWSIAPPPTPSAGVGARARVRANVPGPKDWADIEVKSATAPQTIVEEAVGKGGKRRTRGTYVLRDAPGGGTDVSFTLEYLDAPVSERVLMPLLRAWLQRGNARAMERLGERLR